MAKQTAKKSAPKSERKKSEQSAPGVGHNSDGADVQAELQKLMKRQLAHNKKRKKLLADLNEENGQITVDIKGLGFKRKNFNRAFEEVAPEMMAKDDDDRQKAVDTRVINQHEYHTVYKALKDGQTLNFMDVERMAVSASKRLAEADEKASVQEADV